MNTSRYTPLIILALVAAVVTLGWLYVGERARHYGFDDDLRSERADGQRSYRWRMVTSWPRNFPGLGTGPEQFAQLIDTMSEGRLQIRVYGAGEIVPAMEVFDAVAQGTAEIGHTAAYYWKGKFEASSFFTSVPFGLTAQEMNSWLYYGGGMELWREAYAPFNLVPMAAGNTGVQMAGWFRREINSARDLRGLRMRIPGIGGDVFQRAGGTAVTLPGSELYTSMQTGVIDALEWVGPYNDMALGLHEVAPYYYYPGWQEPGPSLELIINKRAYDSLPEDLRTIVEVAARYVNQDMLDLYTARNSRAYRELRDNSKVQFRQLPDDVLLALKRASEAHVQDMVRRDPMARRIYQSWKAFADDVIPYHRISEKAYINARDLDHALNPESPEVQP